MNQKNKELGPLKTTIADILKSKGYDYLGHFKNKTILEQGHNPAKSKEQYKFMAAVAHGVIKKKGLSKSKAGEFIKGVNYKKLPEREK